MISEINAMGTMRNIFRQVRGSHEEIAAWTEKIGFKVGERDGDCSEIIVPNPNHSEIIIAEIRGGSNAKIYC